MIFHKNRRLIGTMAPLILLIGGPLAFCRTSGPDKFIKVFFPNGRSVTAELAVTDDERARGLMFREKIWPDQGMLFVFEKPEIHMFWMKNTLISLDILWLGGDKRILHIERNLPPCREDPCPTYGPAAPALYVLELQAGAAEIFGLQLNDRLEFILPAWISQQTLSP